MQLTDRELWTLIHGMGLGRPVPPGVRRRPRRVLLSAA